MMTQRCLYRILGQDALARACSLVMLLKNVSVVGGLLLTLQAVSGDTCGFWKHVNALVWIDIQLEKGSGTVARNDKFPDRVGRTILKDKGASLSRVVA